MRTEPSAQQRLGRAQAQGVGCRARGAGRGVQGAGCGAQGAGCRAQGAEHGAQGAGCRATSSPLPLYFVPQSFPQTVEGSRM